MKRVRIRPTVEHVSAGHEGVVVDVVQVEDGEVLLVQVAGVVIAFQASDLEEILEESGWAPVVGEKKE